MFFQITNLLAFIIIYFMTTQHLYFILGIIIFSNLCVSVSNASFNIHVTCHPCSKPCAYENCLRYSSGGYDEEYCGEASCDIRTSSTINALSCNYDYAGKQCPSKICLKYSKQDEGQICASRKYTQLMNKTCSGKNSNFAFKCKDCSGTDNFGSDGNNQTCSANKCLGAVYAYASGSVLKNGNFEDCIGATCNGVNELVDGLTLKYVSCKTDRFGLPCSCCFSQINTKYELKQCLDDVGFNDNDKLNNFKTFVQSELKKPAISSSQKWQKIKLIALCLIGFLLISS